jgi:hypothetical protein
MERVKIMVTGVTHEVLRVEDKLTKKGVPYQVLVVRSTESYKLGELGELVFYVDEVQNYGRTEFSVGDILVGVRSNNFLNLVKIAI